MLLIVVTGSPRTRVSLHLPGETAKIIGYGQLPTEEISAHTTEDRFKITLFEGTFLMKTILSAAAILICSSMPIFAQDRPQ
ncbi:MAG: hypothetical protein ACK5LJ_10270, partial [Paracoccus sp. (in: a-proteobacteria)]